MKKRTVALLCAAVMLLGVVFGGTMAWLSRGSKPLVNTFTAGDIVINLTETERNYIMAPGAVLDKDPTVTVAAGSESCYLFVKVDEVNFTNGTPIKWEVAEGWTKLEDGVYYREFIKKNVEDYTMNETKTDYVFPFLKDNQVSISDTLTKAQLAEYKDSKKPKLTFTAYAIQHEWLPEENQTPAGAWSMVYDQKLASQA